MFHCPAGGVVSGRKGLPVTTYEIKIPTSGWVEETLPGARDIRDVGCARTTAEVEVAPKNGQRRWLSVSLVQVGGDVEIEDEVVYAYAPEGGKIELGSPPASWSIRLVR